MKRGMSMPDEKHVIYCTMMDNHHNIIGSCMLTRKILQHDLEIEKIMKHYPKENAHAVS